MIVLIKTFNIRQKLSFLLNFILLFNESLLLVTVRHVVSSQYWVFNLSAFDYINFNPNRWMKLANSLNSMATSHFSIKLLHVAKKNPVREFRKQNPFSKTELLFELIKLYFVSKPFKASDLRCFGCLCFCGDAREYCSSVELDCIKLLILRSVEKTRDKQEKKP